MLEILERKPAREWTSLSGAGWSICSTPADSVAGPSQLTARPADWFPATMPGTAASALRDAGRWDFEHPVDIDGVDWWFRATFSTPDELGDQPANLCFDGLATLADVWLNGELILTSDNMFRRYRVDVSRLLRTDNELLLRCRSATHDLKRKRARPRWKTNLVSNQQLRWLRTSLQGRIPGWSPPVPAVGPWREIRLETGPVQLSNRRLRTRLDGATGVVELEVDCAAAASLDHAELRVGEHVVELRVEPNNTLRGELRIEHAPLWWPHTHGAPQLLPCEIVIQSAGETLIHKCPSIGFRRLQVDTTDDGFAVRVNDVPIFCRGACWTVSDIFTMSGDSALLERDLTLARDAGANMLRVGGTMCYESDTFYELCDRLGILIWQDFMFANMDYPVHDETFRQNIRREAQEQITRLAAHPCVAVYCGSSEIEQQAAMLGFPREMWSNDWFADKLPRLCADHHPGTQYVPSTPTGGALPFQPDAGLTHYYGVGAYLRPFDDVRRADVRFTPECLGFSNLPEQSTVDAIMGGSSPVTHSPRWKSRVPRDTGAGWDFEDVRDHYVKELFGIDPAALRFRDMPRYFQLGRLATMEAMSQAFSEWRSGHSRNQGALVWFYKDLWPAGGWGIVDSTGMPKAAYYGLKRLWNTRQLTITDEGLNGLHLHLTNETAAPITGHLEVQLLREPSTVIAAEELSVTVPMRSRVTVSADDVLGRFCDVSYAYRFGPPSHDVVAVTWRDAERNIVSEAFHRIPRREPPMVRAAQLHASAQAMETGEYRVVLRSDSFLHGVNFAAPGYIPSDNYFSLMPSRDKAVVFVPVSSPAKAFRAEWGALNLEEARSIPMENVNR